MTNLGSPRGLAVLLVVFWFGLAGQSALGFRRFQWGITREQVKARESTEPSQEDATGLSYKTRVADMEAELHYHFAEDKLYGAGYVFVERRADTTEYLRDFEKIKKIYTERYGPSRVGAVLSLFLAEWETEKTVIRLSLSTSKKQHYVVVGHQSKEHFPRGETGKAKKRRHKP
jgi:hypothetical protein